MGERYGMVSRVGGGMIYFDVEYSVKDFIGKDRLFIIKLIFRCGFFVDVKTFYSVSVWAFFLII